MYHLLRIDWDTGRIVEAVPLGGNVVELVFSYLWDEIPVVRDPELVEWDEDWKW